MPAVPPEPGSTTFVTFYSFKGGVGRSLALLNVATILAGLGRRVLIIDFDLEAPGITLLLAELSARPIGTVKGVVDLIREVGANSATNVLTKYDNQESSGQESEPDQVLDGDRDPARGGVAGGSKGNGGVHKFALAEHGYIVPLKIPTHVDHIAGGLLELMPSGRFEQEYADHFYEVDLAALYREGLGQPMFTRLKKVIVDSSRYDYVLIDSRTGLSDESGICTRDLADRLIILTSLNRQNVEGTCFFLERARAWGGSLAGKLRLVLSPIPLGYEVVRRERQDELMNRVREILRTNVREPISLSYHPRLALDEDPSFEEWTSSPLFQDYRNLASAILEMAEDTPLETVRRLQRALIEEDTERVPLLLDELRARDENLLKAVYDTILTGPPVQAVVTPEKAPPRPDARGYLRKLSVMWPTDVLVRIRLGWQERDLGDLQAATKALRDAVAVAEVNGTGVDEATAREELAKVLHLRGDYTGALDEFRLALALNDGLHRPSGLAACTHSIGEIQRTRGLYSLARADFVGACDQNRRIGRDQGIASNLHGLGLVALFVGDYRNARKALDDSQNINTRVGRWHGVASNKHALGWLEHVCGDYRKSEELFSAAHEIASTLGRQNAIAAALRGLGKTAEALGDFEKARKLFERSLEIEDALDRRPGQLSTRRLLAGLQASLGHAGDAIATLEDVLQAEMQLGRSPLAAATREALGLAALSTRNGDTALRELSHAEREFSALGCHPLAEICKRSAIYANALLGGDWSAAPAELSSSRTLLQQYGHVVAAACTAVLLAEAWQQLEQPQRCLDVLQSISDSFGCLPAMARFSGLTVRGQARLTLGDRLGIEDLKVASQFFEAGHVRTRMAGLARNLLNEVT